MDAENLKVNAIDESIRYIDWSEYSALEAHEVGGRRGVSWNAYEACTCEACGETVILPLHGGDTEHINVDPDATLPPCGLGGHHGKMGPCPDCCDSADDEGMGVCLCEETPCTGHIPLFEGPMMNYFYPCPFPDSQEAAKAIQHLPLCAVEFSSGDTGFALTAGGMDMSWEICAAYVACGFLPPAELTLSYLACNLVAWKRDTAAALKRSYEIRISRTERAIEGLDNTLLAMAEHGDA